jgi:hypothetical protein
MPSFDAGFVQRWVEGLMDGGVLEVCICGWVDLLGEEGEAVLFLVEKGAGAPGDEKLIDLTAANMEDLFRLEKR